MAGAVMRPLAAAGGMQSRWSDGRPMKKVAAGFIKPNDRLTSFERLEIYNRQYWYRLKDCFYDDYPGCAPSWESGASNGWPAPIWRGIPRNPSPCAI